MILTLNLAKKAMTVEARLTVGLTADPDEALALALSELRGRMEFLLGFAPGEDLEYMSSDNRPGTYIARWRPRQVGIVLFIGGGPLDTTHMSLREDTNRHVVEVLDEIDWDAKEPILSLKKVVYEHWGYDTVLRCRVFRMVG